LPIPPLSLKVRGFLSFWLYRYSTIWFKTPPMPSSRVGQGLKCNRDESAWRWAER
jgi:hypothetical protein